MFANAKRSSELARTDWLVVVVVAVVVVVVVIIVVVLLTLTHNTMRAPMTLEWKKYLK